MKLCQFADEPTPIEDRTLDEGTRRGLCLLVIGEGFVATYPLPDSGDFILGRSEDADIPIDAPCVSRRHALLHVGRTIRIEDLGSANGTYVQEARLERGCAADLSPGDVVELGSTMAVLQAGHTAVRPRRIWTHGYFEARLEEECARAERSHGSFSLLRIRAVSRQAKAVAINEILLSALRPGDILASYGPDNYEVLVVDASIEESRGVLERLRRRMKAKGAHIRTGLAHYPSDGRVPEALMAKACGEVEIDDSAEGVDSSPVIVEAGVMKRLHRLVERVAAGSINVLLLGETGVGKEVFAERIHALSARVEKPLLRLNCAALSEGVLESELFGHERGAFTGANAAKPGLLEIADGGTVFLDEIGDMPAAVQAKLLRVLEERCVRRVGGLTPRPIDIRIVAATHRDLEHEIARGTFRQDLFFRLAGITIVIPPLRERVEEIEPLAKSFVASACTKQAIWRSIAITDEALDALCRYQWPGNIRELRNVLERAVLLCTHGAIEMEQLPADKMGSALDLRRVTASVEPRPMSARAQRAFGEGAISPATTVIERVDLKDGVKARERELIKQALEQVGGNQTQAAKLLGISRRTLIDRLEEYGLPRPRKRVARGSDRSPTR